MINWVLNLFYYNNIKDLISNDKSQKAVKFKKYSMVHLKHSRLNRNKL